MHYYNLTCGTEGLQYPNYKYCGFPLLFKILHHHLLRTILPLNDINTVDYLRECICSGVVIFPKRVGLAWGKHPPWSHVVVKPLLDELVNNTDPQWLKLYHHVVFPTLLHLLMLEEGVVLLLNWEIVVGHGQGDILQVPIRYDVNEADGGELFV